MGWLIVGVIATLVLATFGGLFIGIDGFLGGGFIGFLLVALLFYPLAFANYNERTITCQVESKDRGGDNGSYRVYTKDCGTLANSDQWFRGKTESADIWNDIKEGQTHTFQVVGWRFSLLSDFPNILEVKG